MKNIYFKNNHIMSYGTKIVVIIGARGIGKTFSTKKYCLKKFLHDGYKFVWSRATDTQVQELTKDDGASFVADIKGSGLFNPFPEFKVNADSIFINNEHAGYFMPLSTFQNKKGNSYHDVKIFVLDEFIPENGEVTRGDRALQLVNTIETICRLRKDVKIILLANALNKGDPILNLLGVTLKGFGYYVNRKKDCVVGYIPDSAKFEEARQKSISGMLLKGTEFEKVIAKNEFKSDTEAIFDVKPKGLSILAILHSEYGNCRVYMGDDYLYITTDNGNGYPNLRFVNSAKLMGVYANTTVIPKGVYDMLSRAFARGLLRFENEYMRTIFKNFIIKK